MHPAYSVIFFTVFSGAGFGIMVWLPVLAGLGVMAPARGLGLAAMGLALGAAVAGLLSSTFHLGHPERAWRALSQWRTSWLSREGVLSLAALGAATVFAFGWAVLGETGSWWLAAGLAAALLALATLWSTGMIYASLEAVRAWSNPLVPVGYVLFGLASGGLWVGALLRLWGSAPAALEFAISGVVLAAWVLKLAYWLLLDSGAAESTPETATGLGGKDAPVHLLDAPHTQENFVMAEMGYRIARKHAVKLRRTAQMLAFALPLGLVAAAAVLPARSAGAAALGAAILCTVGLLVERWLFFAEARHAVTLYYGTRRV